MRSILSDVNPEQRRAILHGEGPLLVVAGAGSGKTRVITCRIAHLVSQGVAPRRIVALTFTNKAAREMRARVQQLVPAPDLWVCTFHGFSARILRRYADRLGYTPEYSIYDTEDKKHLLKQILKELSFDDLRPAEIAQVLSREKNGMERAGGYGWREERIRRVVDRYAERMHAANAMDFDDLLLNALKLLEDHDEVRAALRDRIHFTLVDEYQDTNDVQYRILRELSLPRSNVCATGDPDQSIYAWRGATIRNILDFERDFPGASVVTLERNYRSTRRILQVANAVIRNNAGRLPKELRTENDEGSLVREVRCLDEVDEARVAVRLAQRWIEAGRRPNDVAVFYRVNAQSRTLERAMAEAGTPYRIVGAVEFYKRKEVKDILAYVRLARNPSDIEAFRRIFNVPGRGLGARTEERLLAAARETNVSPREFLRRRHALAALGRARKSLTALADLLDEIETLPADDPGRFLEGVVDRTGYRAYLGLHTATAERERLENVDELINAAAEFALREPGAGIDGFLEENALVSDQDTYDEAADAVTLMTVHSAKGLEFPCVIVTGLEEQLFPHALSRDTPEGVEEERRLFYVAVTRAKEEACLLWARCRARYGGMQSSLPSRFLEEIPAPLLEVEDRGGGLFGAGEFREDEPVFQLDGDSGAAGFAVGERVNHDHFGAGRVAAIRKSGAATRITVDFDRAGRRELSLAYARLKRM